MIDGLKSDLITSVAGKQDKLVAGSGIQIASDGKTISSSGKEWKIHDSSNIDNIISFQLFNNDNITGTNTVKLYVYKDLKFCIYNTYGPKLNTKHSITYNEFNLPKGTYQFNYGTVGILLSETYGSRYSRDFLKTTYCLLKISKYTTGASINLTIGFDYYRDTQVSSGTTISINEFNSTTHKMHSLPDIINSKTIAEKIGLSNDEYNNEEIVTGLLIKYFD